MGYGNIQDDDPKLTSFDLCRDRDHLGRSKWNSWSTAPDRPHDGKRAVTIVVTRTWQDEHAVKLYCRKHAAPAKGAITRGTHDGMRTFIIESADLSSREAVDAQVAAELAMRATEAAEAKAAREQWVEDMRPQHLLDRVDADASSNRYSVGIGADPTFGTGTVVIEGRHMAPGQARNLAVRLLEAADKAEAIQ